MLARYHCEAHGLTQAANGAWQLEITVKDQHARAPAGSRGRTSALKSIDFVNGVAITQNSVYVFHPLDLTHLA